MFLGRIAPADSSGALNVTLLANGPMTPIDPPITVVRTTDTRLLS
jgi:hypothetical protein